MAIAEAKPAEAARGPDLAAALKDSLIAAIIALAIFFPTLGVKTQTTRRSRYRAELPVARRGHRLRHRFRRPSAAAPFRVEPAAGPVQAPPRLSGGPGAADRRRQVSEPGGSRLRDRPAVSAHVGPLRDGCVDPHLHLRHARLGTSGRGRPGRPARSRICRLLRRRGLFLRTPRPALRVQSSGSAFPLAGILAAFWGIILGFPGPAAARRLSRHRHPGVRRDRAHHSAELAGTQQRPGGTVQHSAPLVLRHSLHPRRERLCRDLRT